MVPRGRFFGDFLRRLREGEEKKEEERKKKPQDENIIVCPIP